MTTIKITDKAATIIEALRKVDSYERESINETLCGAFAAVGNRLAYCGDNSLIPALCVLSEYHDLIEELGKEVES